MQNPHKMLKIFEIRGFLRSAYLKCFWNQFKPVHLQGPAHLEAAYPEALLYFLLVNLDIFQLNVEKSIENLAIKNSGIKNIIRVYGTMHKQNDFNFIIDYQEKTVWVFKRVRKASKYVKILRKKFAKTRGGVRYVKIQAMMS